MIDFRTLKQIGRAGCLGNQAFQRYPEIVFAFLMLFNLDGNSRQAFFQFMRFYVVVLLGNSPAQASLLPCKKLLPVSPDGLQYPLAAFTVQEIAFSLVESKGTSSILACSAQR